MSQSKRKSGAFTLIELLVVVTIIVVLLALLVPAMDKAIYQAELTVCGTKLKGVASAVTIYAAGAKRRYPERMAGSPGSLSPNQLLGRVGFGGVNTWNADSRVAMYDLFKVNAQLSCPLAEEVDLETPSTSNNVIYAPYDLWYSYYFTNDSQGSGRGMFKMGDKWGWAGHRFDVIAGDFVSTNAGNSGYGSHPDKNGVWSSQVTDGDPNPWMADGNTPVTATFTWWAGAVPRGTVDLNFAYQDGSVRRFSDVVGEEENAGFAEDVPRFGDGAYDPTWRGKVPYAD